jgi:hypothetical protein
MSAQHVLCRLLADHPSSLNQAVLARLVSARLGRSSSGSAESLRLGGEDGLSPKRALGGELFDTTVILRSQRPVRRQRAAGITRCLGPLAATPETEHRCADRCAWRRFVGRYSAGAFGATSTDRRDQSAIPLLTCQGARPASEWDQAGFRSAGKATKVTAVPRTESGLRRSDGCGPRTPRRPRSGRTIT